MTDITLTFEEYQQIRDALSSIAALANGLRNPLVTVGLLKGSA